MQNLVNFVIFQLKKSLNCLIGKIQKVKKIILALCGLGATLFPFFASNNEEGVNQNTHSANIIFLFFYNLKIQNLH